MKGARALRAALLYAVLGPAGALPVAAGDGGAELAALRAEIARLAARVAELEARLEEPPAPAAAPAVAPPAAATAALPAPDTPSFSAGGRIKLDLVFNRISSGDSGDDTALDPGSVPLDGHGERDQIDFSARSSRLWLKSWIPTALGEAGAYLEFDMLGSGGDQRVTNGYGVRFRHGYGEIGGVLFGQTYSTFVNVAALPELNDDGHAAGTVYARQPQLRFSRNVGRGRASLAFELPETTLRARSGARLTPDDDRLPDVIVRYERSGAWGNWSAAAMVREIRADLPEQGVRDARIGGAGSVAGLLALGRTDNLGFTAVAGNAVGRYLSFNAFDAGRIDAAGDIALATAAGGTLWWQHLWSERWRSNLVAGTAWQGDGHALDEENEWLYTVHANVLWSPLTSTTLGLEWIHAQRYRFDDRRGEVQRLQFTALHKF